MYNNAYILCDRKGTESSGIVQIKVAVRVIFRVICEIMTFSFCNAVLILC